jgi:hypothetical protein
MTSSSSLMLIAKPRLGPMGHFNVE